MKGNSVMIPGLCHGCRFHFGLGSRLSRRQILSFHTFFLPFIIVFLLCPLFFAHPVRAGETSRAEDSSPEAPLLSGIAFLEEMPLSYAEQIHIYLYEEGFRVLVEEGEKPYLLVPEGKEVPEGAEDSFQILPCPMKKGYLAATSAMALFGAMDGLSSLRFSSLTKDNWYVTGAREAMEKGEILFAGKYSEPDYELLLLEGCDLAMESTMIYHCPKVKEMLESLGIPVFVDRSSYEEHPLGRSEWIKVYGVLSGREEEAWAFFSLQEEVLKESEGYKKTGKKAAFFSVNSMGLAVVRSSSDYVPRMLELAGAVYVPGDTSLLEDTKKSTVSMSMEEFYFEAKEADYLIYNASIEAPLSSVQELVDKNALFADFRAVKEGHVFCTDKYLYQATDIMGELIRDFHTMVTGGEEFLFLYPLS